MAMFEFEEARVYENMKRLCDLGPRVSGSESEEAAVRLIERQFEEYGLTDVICQEFPHKYYDAKLAMIEDLTTGVSLNGVPCWMSAETPAQGFIAETVYIGSHELIDDVPASRVKGRIAFVLMINQHSDDIYEAWTSLYSKHPAAVVFMDLERNLAPRSYDYIGLEDLFSTAPSMVVSAADMAEIHDRMFGSKLRLVVHGKSKAGLLRNVSASVLGQREETVLICAHHDTCTFAPGATDNAAGVAIMLEIARAISKTQPKFTYQFVSFGGEELGMLGSKEFVASHSPNSISLCINIDSIGALPGVLLLLAAGTDKMISWLGSIAKTSTYPARCRRVATSGGDNKVFAANGIPTIHVASHGTTSGKVSHSTIDVLSLLRPRDLGEVGRLSCLVIDSLETSPDLPFEFEIPDDLREMAMKRIAD